MYIEFLWDTHITQSMIQKVNHQYKTCFASYQVCFSWRDEDLNVYSICKTLIDIFDEHCSHDSLYTIDELSEMDKFGN